MPYEEYDPDKNWVYENWVGRETGLGRGFAGAVGNAEYRRRLQERNAGSGFAHAGGRPARSGATPSRPWFPAVDRWLARVPRWLYWLLGSAGAVIGYGYGLDAGWESPWLGAVAGGVLGLALLPLCAFAVKLVLAAIILGLVAGAGYLALGILGAI